jgi:hypothetical protein
MQEGSALSFPETKLEESADADLQCVGWIYFGLRREGIAGHRSR